MSWYKDHSYTVVVLLLLVGLSVFLIVPGYFTSYVGYDPQPQAVIKGFEKDLREDPYDSATLLEAARYHYRSVREALQSGRSPRELGGRINQGLRYYRRLIVNPAWELDRRDYFYASYLYYKMGSSYYDRAKALALESYNQGYRSRSLITLLANLHYHRASSEDDYRVALNYYESLGKNVRDPVLLYNKARALMELGDLDRSREVLERGEQFLDSYPEKDRLLSRYRIAKVDLSIRAGNYSEALSFIETIPGEERSLKLRTQYARCLIELNRTDRARSELEEIVKHSQSPQEAEALLQELTSKSSRARS